MGASSSSYLAAYKSIKEVLKMIKNYNPISFNVYMISTHSINNFIELIKKNNILENLNHEKLLKKLEDELNKDLKKYTLEKNIIIYYQFEQYKKLIEDNNNNNEENEFILVNDTFITTMKIDDKEIDNKKVNINVDKDSNIKIKFPDFDKNVSLTEKRFGFFSLDKTDLINNENNNENNNEIGGFVEKTIILDKNFNMNIQLQILANISKLKNYFLSNGELFLKNNEKYKISKAFSDIISNIWKKDNNNSSDKIDFLKKIIGEDTKLYEPKFLIPFLYEKMKNEFNENIENAKNIIKSVETDKTCAETEYYNFRESFDNKYKSIISDTFYFEQIIKNKCTHCNTEFFDFTMINSLIFDLEEIKKSQNNTGNINALNCFDYFIKAYNNINICVECKKSVRIESIKYMNSFPEILTIILDYENNTKKDIKFDIDYTLELNKYFFNWNNYKKNNFKFELIGMMNYVNENNGNYIGYYKSPVDNKWYTYISSSSDISPIDNINKNKGNPHLLIYQKTNNN